MAHETLDTFAPAGRSVRQYVAKEVLPFERERGLEWEASPPTESRRQVRMTHLD